MHYALPPRKSSRPHPYATVKPSHPPWLRKGRIRALAVIVASFFGAFLIFSRSRRADPVSSKEIPDGTPPIVIVTTLDAAFAGQYEQTIVENRKSYAENHGYATFFPNQTDYDLTNPSGINARSWSKIPAIRHAMALHPHSTYFFYLEQHALIMRPDIALTTYLTDPPRLTTLLIPNKPVVPPDSVIHTSMHPLGTQTDAVFTQDAAGISPTAFLLRRGDWAYFFLDAWFDPLYRSYNFQRAEGHALEHLVQWHPTVLARFGLVPQRTINSYARSEGGDAWQEGDFIASWMDCVRVGSGRSCDDEARPFFERLAISESKTEQQDV